MKKHFKTVGGLRPGKSAFDLTHEYKTSCDFGMLIPCLCEEVDAGDVWKIKTDMIVRLQPLVSPIMHEVNATIHFFFTPFRTLWSDWENFLTGGEEGNFSKPIPLWGQDGGTYGGSSSPFTDEEIVFNSEVGNRYLFDYMPGLPGNITDPSSDRRMVQILGSYTDPNNSIPIDLYRRAYYFIYNEYYRDENLEDKYSFKEEHYDSEGMPIDGYRNPQILAGDVGTRHNRILRRAWEKDYFTSALPFILRGTPPAVPLIGSTRAIFNDAMESITTNVTIPTTVSRHTLQGQTNPFMQGPAIYGQSQTGSPPLEKLTSWLSRNNQIDMSVVGGLGWNQIREVAQLHKWMERNARAGVRYTEFLRSHFGVAPRDDRLQRPEYIGGVRNPVIVSEVLQTSQTTTQSPQATMAGHGLVANQGRTSSYRVQEPGIIMGIFSCMPRTTYTQGIRRQYTRRTNTEFYFREFANLGEQAVLNKEIFINVDNSYNANIANTEFGFQPRYDEKRYIPSYATNLMRVPLANGGLNFWHMGRIFNTQPNLNESFIKLDENELQQMKRIFAVPSQPGLLVNLVHHITAIRPMPLIGEPGLIDHF